MVRVFLSVPMSGRNDNEVRRELEETKDYITSHHMFGDEEIEFIDNLDCIPVTIYKLSNKDEVTPNLMYLGEAIKKMAYCNAAFFIGDWKNARGCRIEHEVCKEYKIISYCFDRAGKHAIIADTFSQ